MSDGITDSYRDQQREERIIRLLEAMIGFVAGDTPATRQRAIAAALACDDVPRGLFGAPTNYAATIEPTLDKLAARDLRAWAQLLALAAANDGYLLFKKLLECSPWAGKRMAIVKFDQRGIEGSSTLAGVLAPYMRQAGNGTTFGGNPAGHFSYAVFFTGNDTLGTIATTAVLLDTHVDSYRSGATEPYLKPASHRIADLDARQKLFDDAARQKQACR